MTELFLITSIRAPAEICFDLMRDSRIHTQMTLRGADSPTAIESGNHLGGTFTWEGRSFGIKRRLELLVVEFDRPRRFVDAMTVGYFDTFFHVHEFEEVGQTTLIKDALYWRSPFGALGEIIDDVLLRRHLTRLIKRRNALLKQIAESDCV